jgi:hypothetical protein
MASEQKNFKKKVVRLPASRLLTQPQEVEGDGW